MLSRTSEQFTHEFSNAEREHDRLQGDVNWRAEQEKHRTRERAKAQRYSRLVQACAIGELEPQECPNCQETAYVRDEANKRDVCLECEYQETDAWVVACCIVADVLFSEAPRKGPTIEAGDQREVA